MPSSPNLPLGGGAVGHSIEKPTCVRSKIILALDFVSSLHFHWHPVTLDQRPPSASAISLLSSETTLAGASAFHVQHTAPSRSDQVRCVPYIYLKDLFHTISQLSTESNACMPGSCRSL